MPTRALRSEASRVPLVAVLLIGTAALLLVFMYATMATQHATGVYIQGQARWMQAHTRTVMFVHRLARTGDLAVFDSVQHAMRIPTAYERARDHLLPGNFDREAAVREFMRGDLTREDAERAATFARLFRYVPSARRTLASWAQGDAQFDSLAAYAEAIRAAHARGDSAAALAVLPRVAAADEALVQLEREFTAGLADTARLLPRFMLLVGMGFAALLVAIGTVTVRGVARTADRSRAAFVEQFQRLQALTEGIPDVITWYDRDHRISFANRAAEELTGIPQAALVGMTHQEIALRTGAGPQVAEQWSRALDQAFAGRRDATILIDVPDGSGTLRAFQVRLVPQASAGGEVRTVVAIGRDVTAVRESEAMLRERDAQLQHAQKLEAVGRLAGGVAHEFNNILTAITANLELAQLSLPTDSEVRDDLQAALTAARRASGLTRQLLAFGRRDAVEPRSIDVHRIVGELDVMLRRLAGEQVDVVIVPAASPSTVMADPGQLQQILLNLVSNARDAMPRGGTMRIEIGRASTASLPALGHQVGTADPALATTAPEWVTLTVRDTGTGMDEATVQRLFEPFFTTKPPGEGTGLGLPVVAGIVAQLGGRIHLDTAPGKGTALTVALPAAAAGVADAESSRRQAADGGPTARVSDAPHGDGQTLLLVEDEAPVRAATKRMLEAAGYVVVEAKHADDALLQWDRHSVDLVVTDYLMPGMNGAELLVRLRERRPALPAVIVSGYTAGGIIDDTALGANTVLVQKPFGRDDLLTRVDALLRSRAV